MTRNDMALTLSHSENNSVGPTASRGNPPMERGKEGFFGEKLAAVDDLECYIELDFLDCIRLINYVRSETRQGRYLPEVWEPSLFDDELYLKPTMEDDAVLYSLDDVDECTSDDVTTSRDDRDREVQDLRERLEHVQMQYSAYREQVQVSFQNHLDSIKEVPSAEFYPQNQSARHPHALPSTQQDQDDGYFNSYSYNTIHEFMLKDTIRTDAYRDFIYGNKHLFAGKTVLDVGCGTGILSLLCAKAGARQVIAVDNSSIIDKARVIVYENGFGNVITCLRGKMEEVSLPVDKVDVIVSEWMGYGLLYESMLDSVLWARDQYLDRGEAGGGMGLMVPSHATLRLAPLISSELRIDHVDFWRSVYGFDMSCMLENVFDEALVRSVDQSDVPSPGSESVASFLELDLHTTTLDDINQLRPFQMPWPNDTPIGGTEVPSPACQSLDGWLIWFDIFFSGPSGPSPSSYSTPLNFSTGPHSPSTHWQQVALLSKSQDFSWRAGDVIHGQIRYRKKEQEGRERSVDIEVLWGPRQEGRQDGKQEGGEVEEGEGKETKSQVWSLD